MSAAASLELWAGAECSVVRVGDTYVDQIDRTGHGSRPSDLDRLAALGVRAFRQPVLWERTAPEGIDGADWGWSDERIARLRRLGIRPIVGLVHHGCGPRSTHVLDPAFAEGLARFASAVAARYPHVEHWTPVNEPLTTARFAALYGHWYPHARSSRAFVRALLIECRATALSMRAIREVHPAARLVQTEDIGTTFATRRLAYQARFENLRRFLSLDLLAGRVDRHHPLWPWLIGEGASERELDALAGEPCPPDIIGVNYYVTSDRFLDERLARYPVRAHGGNGRDSYADVEAARVRARGIVGHFDVLRLVAARYAAPLAITEVHLGGPPEEQIRWLAEAWQAARAARADGLNVCGVTAWSVVGAYDWDSLLVNRRGRYEAGLFDVRGMGPRPTALAQVAGELAARGSSAHPLLAADGWWRRPARLCFAPSGPAAPVARPRQPAPLLVVGAGGTLGRAVGRICRERDIRVLTLARESLDITDVAAIARVLTRVRPWAVVNAAGYLRVDIAEHDRERCWRANCLGAELLATECRSRGIRFVGISSDLVFDGATRRPYVEGDAVHPLCVYGATKAEGERRVLAANERALVVRTSAFFGPWDSHNFVTTTLQRLQRGLPVVAANDAVVSPTYVPDLCGACITLLVDGAAGIWHLANVGAVTWFDLARESARLSGCDSTLVIPCETASLALPARRPMFSALSSARAGLMPSLEDALERFVAEFRMTAATGSSAA
jgi:dTDP-4-dehydrorhamnose reductase